MDKDSGDIDFSGLLDKVSKSGRPMSSGSAGQDDLLKSLEGLTLDLPDGKSPDESTDEELDSLLSDFGYGGKPSQGKQQASPSKSTPSASAVQRPSARASKSPPASADDLGLDELLGSSSASLPRLDSFSDLPPAMKKPSTIPPADADVDLPPLKPGVRPDAKRTSRPVAVKPADADVDLPPLKPGIAAGVASRPATSVDPQSGRGARRPVESHVAASKASEADALGALGVELPIRKAGPESGSISQPPAVQAAEPDDLPPLKRSASVSDRSGTVGRQDGPSRGAPAPGAAEKVDAEDLATDVRPADRSGVRTGTATSSSSLELDDLFPEESVKKPSVGEVAVGPKGTSGSGSIMDELEDLFSAPKPAAPPRRAGEGAAKKRSDVDMDDLFPKDKTPRAPAGPSGSAKIDTPGELDDFLTELAGGKPDKASQKPASSSSRAAANDDLLDELGLPKPQQGAARARSVKGSPVKRSDEDQSLDAFLAELEGKENLEVSLEPRIPEAKGQGTAQVPVPDFGKDQSLEDFLSEITGEAPPKESGSVAAPAGAEAPKEDGKDLDLPDLSLLDKPRESIDSDQAPVASVESAAPSVQDSETSLGVPSIPTSLAELPLGESQSGMTEPREAPTTPFVSAGQPTAFVQALTEDLTCELIVKQIDAARNEDRKYQLVQRLCQQLDSRTVPDLLRLLSDSNAEIRECVVEALGNLGDSRATPHLLKALTVESQNMRYLCAEALGKIGDETSLTSLVGLLDEPDENMKYCAAEALGRIGSEKAVVALISLSNYADKDLRYCIAEALGRIRSARGLEPLVKFLRDPDTEVRLQAVRALGEIRDPSAAGPLLSLMEDATSELLLATVRALGQIGSKQAVGRLLELLHARDETLCEEAIGALGAIRDPVAVAPILDKLRVIQIVRTQRRAIEALGNLGDERAVGALIDLLRLGKESLKLPLVQALGAIRVSSGLKALEELASDADVQIRRCAVVGIGNIEDPSGIPTLMRLSRDPDEGVRREVAQALGHIASEDGIPVLLELLKDADSTVSDASVSALSGLGDAAVQPLVTVIPEVSERVLKKVVQGLGNLGDIRAINPLLALMETASSDVRPLIAQALVHIDDRICSSDTVHYMMKQSYAALRLSMVKQLGNFRFPHAIDIALKVLEETFTDADREMFALYPRPEFLILAQEAVVGVCRSVAELLGTLNLPGSVTSIQARFESAGKTTRRWLIFSLGHIHGEESITALIELLRREDLESEVEEIGRALKRIPLKTVVERLISSLSNATPSTRRRTVRVLGVQEDVRALARLSDLLADPDEGVRLAAVAGLGRIGSSAAVSALTRSVDDVSERVRRRAVEVLAAMADERTLPVLSKALVDRSSDVRQAAALALGAVKSPDKVPALIKGLSDSHEDVRLKVVETLSTPLDPRALEPLVGMLRDVSPHVRQATVRALGKTTDPAVVVPLLGAMSDRDLWVKTESRKTLLSGTEEWSADLIRALALPSEEVQGRTVEILSESRSVRTTNGLLEALGHRNKIMRANAAVVLGNLTEKRAVVPLIGLLDDRDYEVREKAALALGSIGDIAATAALRHAQKDPNKDVRVAAVEALRQIMQMNDIA